MRILLIGGGTGGHITPLLAVAHELKKLDPSVEIVGVLEKNSKFVSLYQNDKNVDRVFQVRAGKYRRYAGIPLWKKLIDVKTLFLNIRDVFYTFMGYFEAKGLIKQLQPDMMLIKGGFVAVPVGKAAKKLEIPYITHDSDSTPGLANKLIAEDAVKNATGMPAELYSYPKEKTVYTGIPLRTDYKKVSPALRASYRDTLGLNACSHVISVIGGSQGASSLNNSVISIAKDLLDLYPRLGLVIVAGKENQKQVVAELKKILPKEAEKQVVVSGFVDNLYAYSGAADLVVSRASATSTAEFAVQSLPVIMVPGKLAGGHQHKNASFFAGKRAVIEVDTEDSAQLKAKILELLGDPKKRAELANNLHKFAKLDAVEELARLTYETAKNR